MTTKLIGGSFGRKAITVNDMDRFLDFLVSDEEQTKPNDLYAAVAWTFWCVNLRANALSSIPYNIYRMDTDENIEENEATGYELDLIPFLWMIEAWLMLHGAAYILKRDSTNQDLQVLNATTVKGDAKTIQDGKYTKFIQQVDRDKIVYDAEDIVYFQTWSPAHDLGAGVASGKVGKDAGALIKHANAWAVSFFENGALPLTILKFPGVVDKQERSRIRELWDSMYQGVKRAFRFGIIDRAERGVDLQVIGQPVKDLTMPQLEKTKRDQVLAAHLIPPGLAEAKTNRAERDALQFELWTQTVIPQIKRVIVPTLNEQLLNPLGMRIGFHTRRIDAIQRRELELAESASFLVNGVMLPAYEANTVTPDEVRRVINEILQWVSLPALDEQFEPEERTPPPQLQAANEEEAEVERESQPGRPVRRGENPPKALVDDLAKWERKAISRIKEGFPARALEFDSDTIPHTIHSLVVYGLERAQTLADVKAVFDAAKDGQKRVPFIAEGANDPLPQPPAEIEIDEEDWDRAIRLWDRKIPEFAGLLDAEVIHKQRFEDAGSLAVG